MRLRLELVARELADGLYAAGSLWFDQIVETTPAEWIKDTGSDVYAGVASTWVGALQAEAVMLFAQNRHLLSKAETLAFTRWFANDLFDDPALGVETVINYAKLPPSERIWKFSSDLAKHITGDTHPLELATHLMLQTSEVLKGSQMIAEIVFIKHLIHPIPWWKRLFN